MGSEALPRRRAIAWLAVVIAATACGRISGLDDLYTTGSATTGTASGSNGSGGGAGVGGSGATSSSTNGSGGMFSSGGSDAGGTAPTYADLVLDDSPLAYWRLDEANSGQAAEDSSEHMYQGHYFGGGLTFGVDGIPGTTDHAIENMQTCPDGDTARGVYLVDNDDNAVFEFEMTASFTLEAWVFPTCDSTVNRRVLSKDENNTPEGHGWFLQITGSTNRFFFKRVGELDDDFAYGPDNWEVAQQQWTHVAVVFDGAAMLCTIWHNGEPADPYTCNANLPATTAQLRIGIAPNDNFAFAGRLDEVAIYGKALDGTRITAHYEKGKATRQ